VQDGIYGPAYNRCAL